MRLLCLLFLVIIGAAIVLFVRENSQDVTMRFWDRTMTLSIAELAGIAYGLGMLTGWSVVGLLRRSFNRATDFQDTRAYPTR